MGPQVSGAPGPLQCPVPHPGVLWHMLCSLLVCCRNSVASPGGMLHPESMLAQKGSKGLQLTALIHTDGAPNQGCCVGWALFDAGL